MRAAILMLMTFLAAGILGGCEAAQTTGPSPRIAIGGPFRLADTTGHAVSEQTLIGKPTALFFGFTYCPEVCPTTLSDLSAAINQLGKDADKLNYVFISVDPERDTPEQLKRYLSSFDSRIQGFTGSPEAVAAVAKAYRIYYRKVPVGDSYTVDHSASVYLFDRNGGFVEPVGYGSPQGLLASKLRSLIAADQTGK
jgi:protein SCO1/2